MPYRYVDTANKYNGKGDVPVHALTAYGGTGVQCHPFLTSTPDGSEGLTPCLSRFNSNKELLYPSDRRLDGPNSKLKILRLKYKGINKRRS
jgi:hypothetical protein